MHNFGKLKPGKMTFGTVDVLAFFDENGVEWHDLFKAFPADFYVALDDRDRVVSFQIDPEHSQIGDHTILGLSTAEASGLAMGEAYGKQWNGTALVDPILTRDEYPILLPTTFWKAAREIGVYKADIVTQINAMPDETAREDALIDLEECSGFIRLNPLVVSMTDTYNITPEQLDTLWLWAANTQV